MSDKQDIMYGVANSIAKGAIGQDFVFCLEEGKFYHYQNQYWKKLADIEVMDFILKSYSGENKKTVNITNFPITRRKQILENLKQLVFKRLQVFNSTGYLNFDLGEFDPITCTMNDHNKEHYSTFRMSYPYDERSECPLWIKTLNEIFEGNMDKSNTVQEFFGYCLTRDVRKEKALLLLGQSRSGKSTILETLSYMIGEDNCAFVSLDYIFHPQYSPLLMNKLVNIDTDVSAKASNYEREFKTITSGEPITCNQKFVETFKFRPYCKVAMAANVFPRITDHSSAFYNRLILLPCNRVFDPHEQNLKLKDQLLEELPGIFNWAVAGLKRLQERGDFKTYHFMTQAVEELEDENNPANVFFNEYIVFENGAYEEKSKLFEKYIEWCIRTNTYKLSAITFGKCLFNRFPLLEKGSRLSNNGPRVFRNIKYVPFKLDQIAEEIRWQN